MLFEEPMDADIDTLLRKTDIDEDISQKCDVYDNKIEGDNGRFITLRTPKYVVWANVL